jgi:uncharacterized secreted protein with C-terminal beta-propeller domain
VNSDEARQHLEALAEQGTPRGAGRVLAAARRGERAFKPSLPRLIVPIAIATCVTLIGGVAAAVWSDHDDKGPEVAAPVGSTTTAPPTTITQEPTTAIPTVTLPAKLIAASRLKPLSTCGTYLSYVRREAVARVGPYGLPSQYGYPGNRSTMAATGGGMAGGAAGQGAKASSSEDGSAPPAAVAATAAPEAAGYSQTNVQEAGIDEPDTAKTDGRTIFVVTQGRIFAVAAQGEPRILSSVPAGDLYQLLLIGDRLIGIGSGTSGPADAQYGEVRQTTVAAVFDVSRPDAMRLVSRFEADGGYVSARVVGGTPRIVLRSEPTVRFPYPTEPSPDPAALTERNRQIVVAATASDWLPGFRVTDPRGRQRASGRLVSCDATYRPPTFAGFGMVSVVSLNMADPQHSHASGVVAGGSLVYSSSQRLYVATQGWMSVDGNGVPSYADETLIHSFDVSDPASASYRVSGKVRGIALNQFSLSEHNGVLRIATTASDGGNESFVTTLTDQGQALVQVGQVGGLGKGERIYAVRFLGDVGYVVTFRQVDPLYVVDLSDPANPRVTGELKISGYSAYLHPIGDSLLIGIGQDATEEGFRQGVQVSLFDVSDPASPKRLQHHALGSGNSAVEYDHHAFLYWAPLRLAMIPLSTYSDQGQTFQGAVGLQIDRDAIKEIGRVGHPDSSPVVVSLVVGDRLFTVSLGGVAVSDLATVAGRQWIPLG